MKKAYLVTVELTTRIVIEENSTDEEMYEKALPNFHAILTENKEDNISEVVEDGHSPAGSLPGDKTHMNTY